MKNNRNTTDVRNGKHTTRCECAYCENCRHLRRDNWESLLDDEPCLLVVRQH